jgi:hypothetical protein
MEKSLSFQEEDLVFSHTQNTTTTTAQQLTTPQSIYPSVIVSQHFACQSKSLALTFVE